MSINWPNKFFKSVCHRAHQNTVLDIGRHLVPRGVRVISYARLIPSREWIPALVPPQVVSIKFWKACIHRRCLLYILFSHDWGSLAKSEGCSKADRACISVCRWLHSSRLATAGRCDEKGEALDTTTGSLEPYTSAAFTCVCHQFHQSDS